VSGLFTPAGVVLVAMLCFALPVRAYDVELDAETLFRAYEVRAPTSSTTWTRRRIVQDLELRLSEALALPRGDRPSPRLHAVVQLRLSQDAGDTCRDSGDRCFDASDARAASTYQALAVDGVLDAMLAYVDVTGMPGGFEARAGRQLWIDPVGFARIDGASARLAPTAWLAVSAVAGLQVRATSVAGTSAFEPPGVLRMDLSPREQLLATHVSPASRTGLFAGALEVGDESIVRGQASMREVIDQDGLVMRRVGLSLRSSPLPALHLSSLGVLDATDWALVQGHLSARWLIDPVALRATLEVMRPRFDLGSIWAYFPTAAVEQAELGASANVSERTHVGGGLRGRRTRMRGEDDHDAGAHLFATTRVGSIDMNADGYVWLGDLGDLWGVDASASRHVSAWLRTELGVSAQRVSDPAQLDFDGVSVAEWMRAVWQLTPRTQASLELSHAYNRRVRHRLALLASLQLGAWR
jgi:hypothetical protein